MLQTRSLPAPKRAFLLLAGLFATALAAFSLLSIARALPPGGVDAWDATAEVVVASRIGQETINLTGNVTVSRDDPHDDGGVQVADLEIVALNLTGDSIAGPVEITESPTLASTGELRSNQPAQDFPASSFFDAFLEISIPTAGPSPPTVHNEEPLRVTASAPLNAWPPVGATYEGAPVAPVDSHCEPPDGPGGLPLLPSLPAEICILSVTLTVGDAKTPQPTPTITSTPTSTNTPPPTNTPTPGTPTSTPGGPTATATDSPTPTATSGTPTSTPIPSAGNDNFADAMTVATLPFLAEGNTDNTSTEPGEPLNPTVSGGPCITVGSSPVKGSTVWFKYVPTTSQTLVADTIGSILDTVLAVYTGSSVSNLTPVACNDDGGPGIGLQSRISFQVVAGQTYYFQLGGYQGSSGFFTINIGPTGFVTPTPTITPGGGPVGDANCSGGVNSLDAAVLLQAVAGIISAVPCPDRADANLDGAADAIDASLVLQLEAGIIASLPP